MTAWAEAAAGPPATDVGDLARSLAFYEGTLGLRVARREDGARHVSIGMGTVDEPTGLQLERHIYVDFKGDYYDIADGLPQEDSA